MRGDLADVTLWRARFVVLAYAVMAGVSVVVFTWATELALDGFERVREVDPLLPLLWTPAWTALIAWLTLRYVPGASGSGIPQVMAALHPSVREEQVPLFVSLRMSAAKLVLTAGALLGGLAVGREGPSVQIAAGVMLGARRWLPKQSALTSQGLLVAGGAAGIAAAFNAPLAGVMFAIEEFTRKIEHQSSGLIITAIVLAGLVGVSAFGNQTYFGVIRVPALPTSFILPGLLVVIAGGLLGGLFARGLHAVLVRPRGGRLQDYRRAHPVRFAAACGMAVAILGVLSDGASFGSGYEQTRGMIDENASVPALYVLLRMLATWLAAWSGVPGGIFAPSLAIGAGIGHDVAILSGWTTEAPALIALGMTAFLAAVTQTPLTAFIIVMEMVDGHAMVLSLMAAALGASLVSRWISRPLYQVLAQAQLERAFPPEPPQAEAARQPESAKP